MAPAAQVKQSVEVRPEQVAQTWSQGTQIPNVESANNPSGHVSIHSPL
jgi:hypothetical protein